VENMQLIRVAVNMMKNNFIYPSLSVYLRKLVRRITKEEFAVMTQYLFDYEPIPRKRYLDELLNFDDALFCPTWFSAQMWILQFEDTTKQVARKIWNKYGLVLKDIMKLSNEESDRNVFMYLRYKNTAISDATVKATVAAIEI
jgi:hypothetical protein